MKKWEYFVGVNCDEAELDRLGGKPFGWELVAVVAVTGNAPTKFKFYFKRLKL